MDLYSKEQRIVIVKIRSKFGESLAETIRKVRGIVGIQISLNKSTVGRLIKKFEETGSVMDKQTVSSPPPLRSTESIAVVK